LIHSPHAIGGLVRTVVLGLWSKKCSNDGNGWRKRNQTDANEYNHENSSQIRMTVYITISYSGHCYLAKNRTILGVMGWLYRTSTLNFRRVGPWGQSPQLTLWYSPSKNTDTQTGLNIVLRIRDRRRDLLYSQATKKHKKSVKTPSFSLPKNSSNTSDGRLRHHEAMITHQMNHSTRSQP
jgi:hypothetical protein